MTRPNATPRGSSFSISTTTAIAAAHAMLIAPMPTKIAINAQQQPTQ